MTLTVIDGPSTEKEKLHYIYKRLLRPIEPDNHFGSNEYGIYVTLRPVCPDKVYTAMLDS